jgi:hypothetical protein
VKTVAAVQNIVSIRVLALRLLVFNVSVVRLALAVVLAPVLRQAVTLLSVAREALVQVQSLRVADHQALVRSVLVAVW